ncbi:MAG: hypothetical protein ABI823_17640 [Bryobacteraceae bacterium]
MKLCSIPVVWLAFTSVLMGQTVVRLEGLDIPSKLNQQLVEQRRGAAAEKAPAKNITSSKEIVVFAGDRVIPQFVDGASWKTSMYFVNLENRSVSFQVLFFDDVGNDMLVPIVGQGRVRGLNITLQTAGSIQLETNGTAADLTQGWALLSQTTNDSVGGLAVFRQAVSGRQAQEAVVPIVSQFDNHFVLLFDNTDFATGIAVANPTTSSVNIPVTIRNQAGQVIDQRTINLGPYSHTAFVLSDFWGSTAGRRGAIEFLTSGFGVAALGLRFNGAAFTSFHVLENVNWIGQ